MDILASKSELKQIIQNSINELLIPIKENVEQLNVTINRDSKLNYLNSIARLLKSEAIEIIENFSCSYHITTETLCKSLLRDYINQYTEALSIADLAGAFSILAKFEDLATQNAKDVDKTSNCKKDWEFISSLLKRHRDVVKEISVMFTTRDIPSDVKENNFSPDELFKDVIFPFSHPLRLGIVHKLKSGNMRFTDLKNELNVKNTGLLVHHLKPLMAANLVIQDHKKQYSLSDRGFLTVKYLTQLSNSLKPELPITVTIKPLVVLNNRSSRPLVSPILVTP